ncbi:5972_t:CDS:1, partial [Gigaspora rosea]
DSEKENEILFNTNKDLSKEQYKQAECLLHNNIKIFAQKISKDRQTVGLEQTNLVCHEIDIDNAKPISQHLYTLARDKQEFLQKEILAIKNKESFSN